MLGHTGSRVRDESLKQFLPHSDALSETLSKATVQVAGMQPDPSSPTDLNQNPRLMKTRQSKNKLRELFRRIFRRSTTVHDPWLSVSMTLFNYTDGWSRTFAKAEYARSWA